MQIAPGVEGYAFVDPETNELVTTDSDVLGTDDVGLRPATPAEIDGARRGHAAQGVGQKALGLGEKAVRGATFGQIDADTPEARARRQVLDQQNPILSGLATGVGATLPALAVGAATGGLGAAAGLGAVARGATTFGAEALAESAATEFARAAETDSEIEIGNIAQGLLEGAAFLGVAHGIGALARRGRRAVSGADAPAIPEADASSAVARGVAQKDVKVVAEAHVPTKAEAREYADNAADVHQEVTELAYAKGNDMWGRDGSFHRAHSVAYKREDMVGKMPDADPIRIEDVTVGYADALDQLADNLSDATRAGAPSPAAARTIRQVAKEIRGSRAKAQLDGVFGDSGGVADAAISVDRAKRHLDDLRERFGSHSAKTNDPTGRNVTLIDEVLEPMRKGLEDPKVWGKDWARKQAEENKLWSGADGIINQRAIWQAELAERLPGAAGKQRIGLRTMPVYQMRADVVEHVLGLPTIKRRQVLAALEKDLTATEKMSKIKAAVSGPEARTAVAEVAEDVAGMREIVAEIRRLDSIRSRYGQYFARAQKIGKPLDAIHDASSPIGAVAGVAQKGLRKVVNEATARPDAPPVRSAKFEALRSKIDARKKQGGWIELPGGGQGPAAPSRAKPSFTPAETDLVDRVTKDLSKLVREGASEADILARLDEDQFGVSGMVAAEIGRAADVAIANRKRIMSLPVDDTIVGGAPDAYRPRVESQKAVQLALTPEEGKAVRDYTSAYYQELKAAEQGLPTKRAKQIPALYSGMRKLEVPDPTDMGPLYRGLNISEDGVRELLTNDQLTAHSMLSTSYSANVSEGFSNGDQVPVFLRIKKAYVGAMPYNPVEAEVLIPRGANFRVTGRSATSDGRLIVDLVQTGVVNPAKSKGVRGMVQIGDNLPGFLRFAGSVAKSPLGVGTAAAGALVTQAQIRKVSAETEAIRGLDQHSKDTTERAMSSLAHPEDGIPALPPISQRFQGDSASLQDAYRAKMADLKRLVDDPEEFIARSTAAFQPLADAGHPEVASKLITRMMVGARYLLENAPPSIAVSMFTPDGGTPDEIAILQYAPVWEAVWRPIDAVRDFASRRATPSAIKAIREVHPDVYARMQAQVFQTLAAGGPAVDFETKRYLDNTMQMGAALGRSFSPKMSDLLATMRQDQKQSTKSLGGENNIAPETATVGFSKGPTTIR